MDEAKREKAVADVEKFEAARVEMREAVREGVRVAIRAALEGTDPFEPAQAAAPEPVRYVQRSMF